MKIFMDTSVLIKRYLVETGSDKIDKLFESASQIIVSPVTSIEARSILRRLLAEKKIARSDYKKLNEELTFDFDYFTVVNFDPGLEVSAKTLIDRYQLKTLDAIQLASAILKRTIISLFAASDKKLLAAARDERFKVIDPSASD